MNEKNGKVILIQGGRVVDPTAKTDGVADLLIRDGKIEKVGKGIAANGAQVLDAKGKVVAPGFIDLHVHLREPGFEYKETIETGTRSAARGGFTTVCCMPNTKPPIDNEMVVEYVMSVARQHGKVNVLPVGAITVGQMGERIAEIGALQRAGVVAISDDGKPVKNAEIMRRALEYARMFDLPVIDHCEDLDLSKGGVMHEGYTSTVLGLRGIPSEAESIMVARDIQLARLTGARIHIAHLSTLESVELVRQGKKAGLPVTCEVTPHHFSLTDEALLGYHANCKMNPPLREKEDVAAVLEGLRDGTIDCIATDHAPHAEYEKQVELEFAPFGIVGLETAVGLGLTHLVNKKVLTLSQWIEKMSANPARFLKLKNKGGLKPGMDADVTVLDIEKEVAIDVNQFESKSKNSPFHGMKLRGEAFGAVVGGKVVMWGGKIL